MPRRRDFFGPSTISRVVGPGGVVAVGRGRNISGGTSFLSSHASPAIAASMHVIAQM
jgi:hypothetical protein